MSDPTSPEDLPSDRLGPPPGFAESTPLEPDARPSGFANYSAYEQPNVEVTPTPTPERTEPSAPPKRRGLVLLVAIVVVAAVAIGGFILASGGSDDGADADTPGAAALAWLDRMADEDYSGACKLLAARSVDVLAAGGSTCPKALMSMNPGGLYSDADQAEIASMDIEGDRAEVTISSGGMALDGRVIVVVDEDGAWMASPFEGPDDGTQTEPRPAPDPRDDTGGASAAACQTTIATVETAAEAYEAVNGSPPTDVQALVDEGFLRELPDDVAIQGGTVTGTGPCA